jgi:ankyrin repeat protein
MECRHLVVIAIAGAGLLIGGSGARAHEPSPASAESPSTPPLPDIPKKPDPVLCAPAMDGDLRRVQALLRAGADVNVADEIGRTPLMLALSRYYPPAGGKQPAGSPAAEAQRQVRKLKIARLLIKRGADIKRTSTIGMTALHYAVMFPDEATGLAFTREFLAGGALVDARMGTGVTPLRMAVDRGRVTIARLLIEAGANPRVPDDVGKTPLAHAQALGPRELVAALTAPAAPSPAPASPTPTTHATPAKSAPAP